MNTTNYTIELLISGICGAVWIFVFSLIIFEGWFNFDTISLSENIGLFFSLVLIPFLYILGIIIDRTTDIFFGKSYTKKIRSQIFENDNDYKKARSIIYIKSENLSKIIEYNRMRIRICRNWLVNGTIMLIGLIILIIQNEFENRIKIILFISILMIFSLWVSYKSWKKLHKKEYEFLKIQSLILMEEASEIT